jgi:hypothetical protein
MYMTSIQVILELATICYKRPDYFSGVQAPVNLKIDFSSTMSLLNYLDSVPCIQDSCERFSLLTAPNVLTKSNFCSCSHIP